MNARTTALFPTAVDSDVQSLYLSPQRPSSRLPDSAETGVVGGLLLDQIHLPQATPPQGGEVELDSLLPSMQSGLDDGLAASSGHGDSLDRACDVGVLNGTLNFHDRVDRNDVSDYYRFELSESEDFNLTFENLNAYARLELLDSNGDRLTSTYGSSTTTGYINQTLSAGTYYIHAEHAYQATDYGLMLSTERRPGDGAGNSLADAHHVGLLDGTMTFNDRVARSDGYDYYRFELGESEDFNLTFGGLSAYAKLELLNSSGNRVASTYGNGTTTGYINQTLSAGTYYVLADHAYSDTDYALTLSTERRPGDGAGNSFADARNVGLLDGTITLNDRVSRADGYDYYRFELGESEDFNLTFGGLSAYAKLELLNSSGNRVASTYGNGTTTGYINRRLDAGTYYVLADYAYGDTDYALTLSTERRPGDGAGNSLADAENVGLLNGTVMLSDRVDRSDYYDIYRFRLTDHQDFNLTFDGLTAYSRVHLLDQAGNTLTSTYGSSTTAGYISDSLAAGDYYVQVSRAYSDTNYDLTLSTALRPDDTAGNSLSTALDLGILGPTLTLNERIGDADPSDYYRFELTSSSQLALDVSEQDQSLYLNLLNENGQRIDRSYASYLYNSGNEIDLLLEAGTYYLHVEQFLYDTSYQVDLDILASSNPDYSLISGHGLVDAAAAVAASLNQPTFAPIAPLPDSLNAGGADLIQAPEVWNQGYTGQGVVVAVLDTGVDITHSDLNDNIWINSDEIAGNGIDDDGNGYIDDVFGWDFVGQDAIANDIRGHGTHVAGTIAAENNGYGALGVAYNAQIMPVKVLSDVGRGTQTNIAAGIRYAVDNGAQVINLSLSGESPTPEIQAALQYAEERGVFSVIASGNWGRTQPDFPARYATDYGIAVGAVDPDGDFATFSNKAGSDSNLAYVVAPGVGVYSTSPNERYRFSRGTSMAAPHVAGIVALMLSANPDLSPQLIRSILTETAIAL